MAKSKKSGFVSISPKAVDESIKHVEKARELLGSIELLTTRQRKAQPKLHRGAQQVIPMLVTLAESHGIAVSTIPIGECPARIEHGQRLRQVLGAVVVLEKSLKDAILLAEGDAWETATATYSMLRRAAKRDPALAAQLADIESWFRRRGSRSKAGNGSGSPPPTAEPSPKPVTSGSTPAAAA